MKDDKFCVSKTVAFLVSLIVIVGGIFYVMNYANTTKLTTDSEAAGGKCTFASVARYPAGCGVTSGTNKGFSTAMGTKFVEDSSRNYFDRVRTSKLISRCCVAVPEGQTTAPPDSAGIKAQQDACAAQANQIVAKNGQRCTYYDGGWQIKNKYVYCTVKMSDDFNACSPAIGSALATTTPKSLETLCRAKANTVVPGSKYTSPNQNVTCLVYTGGYRSGNQSLTPVSGDLKGCLRVSKADLWDESAGALATSNCP